MGIKCSDSAVTALDHTIYHHIHNTITITANGNFISQVVHIIRKHMQVLYTIEAMETERAKKKKKPNTKLKNVKANQCN